MPVSDLPFHTKLPLMEWLSSGKAKIGGGMVIGDAPSWRVDKMPYGGAKDSDLGRES